MSSRNSIDKITDKNALSIGESIGWKKLVGQVELPKLNCEVSGWKGREHSEDYIPKFTLSILKALTQNVAGASEGSECRLKYVIFSPRGNYRIQMLSTSAVIVRLLYLLTDSRASSFLLIIESIK
jgi:hypothetical protein